MPGIHATTFPVPVSAIDANGHVNNVEYLRWMQDIAVAHSAAHGWDVARYDADGGTWVARSHYIEYLGAAFEGDVLSLYTWVDEPGSSSWLRHYAVRRGRDPGDPVIARAETLWVYVDTRTGRARRIPEALRAAFEPATAERLTQLGLGADGAGRVKRR